MKHLRTIAELPVKNKRVLLRVDFNTPLNKFGEIADDTRIRAALPTIQLLLSAGASLTILSHIGKSGENLSLFPAANRLSKLLGKSVLHLTLEEAQRLSPSLSAIIMVENLRNFPEEQAPSDIFAKRLATLGDFFVSDAFATLHRDNSSITRLPLCFPNKSAAGLLVEREVSLLQSLLTNPKRPFYCLIGGSKVSSKLAVLQSLLKCADAIFIGGAMAFTFMKAAGRATGDSPVEHELLPLAGQLLNGGVPIHLPIDFRCATSLASSEIVVANEIGNGLKGFDIGEATVAAFSARFKKAKTLFWNGPVGLFEDPRFDFGTRALANALSDLKETTTIVGGGDSVAAINSYGLESHFSHISTGGGATLEFIESGTLLGLKPLMKKE